MSRRCFRLLASGCAALAALGMTATAASADAPHGIFAPPAKKTPPQLTPSLALDKEITAARNLATAKKFPAALALLTKADAKFKAAGDKIKLGNARADVHFAWGDERKVAKAYEDAIGHFETALKWDEKNRPAYDTHWDYRSIGLCEYFQKNYSHSIVAFIKSYNSVAEEKTQNEIAGDVLVLLASALYAKSEYKLSIDMRWRANTRFERLADSRERTRKIAENADGIAGDYQQIGDYKKSLELARESIRLHERIKNEPGVISALCTQGWAAVMLTQYEEGVGLFNQALERARTLKDEGAQANALNNLGVAYIHLGRYEEALTVLQECHRIAVALQDYNIYSAALGNAGEASCFLGDYEQALRLWTAAEKIFDNTLLDMARRSRALTGIGMALDGLKRWKEANEKFEKARFWAKDSGDRQSEADTYTFQGLSLLHEGNLAEAARKLNEGVVQQSALGNRDFESESLDGLMQVAQAQKQPNLAIFWGKQAVNTKQAIRSGIKKMDKESRQSYDAKAAQTYRTLADLLIGQGRLAEAQNVISLLKEQELFEFVRGDEKKGTEGLAALTPAEAAAAEKYKVASAKAVELGVRYSALLAKSEKERTPTEKAELADIIQKLAAANDAFQDFLDNLEAEFSKNSGGGTGQRVAALREAEKMTTILQKLGTGNVAVYALAGDTHVSMILCVGGAQVGRTSPPITLAELNKKIAAFRDVLQNPKADPRPLGKELYDLLIAPLEKDLEAAGAKNVLWSLDGALRYLPIAALWDGKQYVVEKWRSSLFSTASLDSLVAAPDPDWNALAVGVTLPHTVGETAFNPLPGVQEEIGGIVGLPSSGAPLTGTALLDAKFTQVALTGALVNGYKVVHIASHFAFKPGDETASFLLLGDGATLTMKQMRRLPNLFSGVRLITLSACDTATTGSGSEVESFGALAQQKGADAVLASLWSVSDASTQKLMQGFYRLHALRPDIPKAEALREAQIALLTGKDIAPSTAGKGPETGKRAEPSEAGLPATSAPAFTPDPAKPFAHPFYWAAFVLTGNGQ